MINIQNVDKNNFDFIERHKRERGFSIVIELTAMVIALLLLVALNKTIETGIEANSLSGQRAYAVSLAEGVTEASAIKKSSIPVSGSRVVSGVTYAWSLAISTTPDGYLYKTIVRWGYTSPNHNITLKRLVGFPLP